jgi:hypothetical protein
MSRGATLDGEAASPPAGGSVQEAWLVEVQQRLQTGDGLSGPDAARLVRLAVDQVQPLQPEGPLLATLHAAGPAIVPWLLEAYAILADADQRGQVADLLVQLQVRDPRILALWLERLDDEADLAATALAAYGDAAAVPRLRAWWQRFVLPERPLHARLEAIEAALSVLGALQDLGAPLSGGDIAQWDQLLELRDASLGGRSRAPQGARR